MCLLPGAVTFSCVRSMSCLHRSECVPSSFRRPGASDRSHLNLGSLSPPQAAPVWRLRGSEGSSAKPSTCCSSWTSEKRRPAGSCRSHAQVCAQVCSRWGIKSVHSRHGCHRSEGLHSVMLLYTCTVRPHVTFLYQAQAAYSLLAN